MIIDIHAHLWGLSLSSSPNSLFLIVIESFILPAGQFMQAGLGLV